jgi:hypothetical protein
MLPQDGEKGPLYAPVPFSKWMNGIELRNVFRRPHGELIGMKAAQAVLGPGQSGERSLALRDAAFEPSSG